MTYAIYTTGRSGSNWLCGLLRSTKKLGSPKEWFNPGVVGDLKQLSGLGRSVDNKTYWERVVERYGTDGVQGVKCTFDVAPLVYETTKPDVAFHLRRKDRLGQAISLYRAITTDQWSHNGLAKLCEISVGRILEQLGDVCRSERRFLEWFGKTGQAPLALYYEDLVRDPGSIVRQIAERVGVGVERGWKPEIETRVQRDEWTDRARAVVRDFFGDCDSFCRGADAICRK